MEYLFRTAVLLLAALLAHEVRQTISVPLSKAAPSESREHIDVFKDLQLLFDRAMDKIVPLEIVVDEDFTGWKQLSEEEEATSPTYALEILNKNLPEELATCYRNMTKEKLESDVHSPAEYGDRMCGKLDEAASCTDRKLGDTKEVALLQFSKEVTHLKKAFCDPDCPFAQAESCKTHLMTTSSNISSCSISGALECVDTLLTELKCNPEAIAVVYWMQTKLLAKLKQCEIESEECLADVRICLKPFSDYLRNPDLLRLCRGQGQTRYCIKTLKSCNHGVEDVMNATTTLFKDACETRREISDSILPLSTYGPMYDAENTTPSGN
ncbi:uncharacterized protein [Watersipora subatra]|uniref:uncharacterized protein n=1 Tax=Watersipora subatra TaxID=2589382 RepID=UPI00355C76C5